MPTRNRFEYAIWAVRSLMAIEADDLQIVIQDSSDNERLGTWLSERAQDRRITYSYASPPVSMTDNFEKGVALARGDYVCVIGDDDGVNPEIITIARWAKSNRIAALLPKQLVHYGWPDLRQRYYGAARAGKLEVAAFRATIDRTSARSELEKCARYAGQRFFEMPRIYYGIVASEMLARVKGSAGYYFPGISPDMALSVALACIIDEVYVLDYPIFVPGSSKNSNAGLSSLKRHVGQLEAQQHLGQTFVEQWSKYVPKFYAVETVWAEAMVTALQSMGESARLKRFNIGLLHAMCLVFHPSYGRAIFRSLFGAIREKGTGVSVELLRFCTGYAFTWWLRAKALRRLAPVGRLRRSSGVVIEGIGNIEEAVDALSVFLEQRGAPAILCASLGRASETAELTRIDVSASLRVSDVARGRSD